MTPTSNVVIMAFDNEEDVNKLRIEGDKWVAGIATPTTFITIIVSDDESFVESVDVRGAENVERFSLHVITRTKTVNIFYLVFSICRVVCYACVYTILCV